MFLSIDGVDGVGKSTQIQRLAEWLRSLGRTVVTCRDPGSTPLGESLRRIVLSSDTPIHRRSEMLLYMAARAQMVEEVIRPALAAGQTVVSDRFLLANVVYQGHAGGLPVDEIWEVGRVAIGGVRPDLTIVLDLPAADAAARRQDRGADRMESQGLEFLERVRQGFLAEAARTDSRIVVLNAAEDRDCVEAAIRRAVSDVLARDAEGRLAEEWRQGNK